MARAAPKPHCVWLLAYDGMQALDLTGPHEVFASANRVADGYKSDRPRYELHVIGSAGTSVTTESGLEFLVSPLPTESTRLGTVLVPGGDSASLLRADDPIVEWLALHGSQADRLATVCTGAFVAAQAGLLDGHRVATHWARAKRLATRFPELDVDGDAIYVRDRSVWSSAGVTAGIDLALAIVESDFGTEIAQEVARWLVVFLRRPGGQSQFAPTIWSRRAGDGPIRQAQDLIDLDPSAVTSVASLANEVGLSPRQFSRRFSAEVGKTPARYLEEVRLAAARHQLEATDDGVRVIANRCGFGTDETLRRSFQRSLGVSPDQYRQRFTTVPNRKA